MSPITARRPRTTSAGSAAGGCIPMGSIRRSRRSRRADARSVTKRAFPERSTRACSSPRTTTSCWPRWPRSRAGPKNAASRSSRRKMIPITESCWKSSGPSRSFSSGVPAPTCPVLPSCRSQHQPEQSPGVIRWRSGSTYCGKASGRPASFAQNSAAFRLEPLTTPPDRGKLQAATRSRFATNGNSDRIAGFTVKTSFTSAR